MGRLVAILCCALCASTLNLRAQSPADPYALVGVGDKAPDFEVTMSDGNTVKLSEQQGKVVWILFWASWCPSCRKEITHIEYSGVVQQLQEQYNERFLFLPIAREENRATVERWLKKMDIEIGPYACDEEREIYSLYATEEIPRNIIVAPDGTIAHHSSNFSRKGLKALGTQAEALLRENNETATN